MGLGVRTCLLCHYRPQLREVNATLRQPESQPHPESYGNLSDSRASPSPHLPSSPQTRKLLLTLLIPPQQVVKHLPKAHILACAPSNSGADLLCQRLRTHLPRSIYRLLAPSRDIRMVPEDIKVPGQVQGALRIDLGDRKPGDLDSDTV